MLSDLLYVFLNNWNVDTVTTYIAGKCLNITFYLLTVCMFLHYYSSKWTRCCDWLAHVE